VQADNFNHTFSEPILLNFRTAGFLDDCMKQFDQFWF
jgi:hypothetical protein